MQEYGILVLKGIVKGLRPFPAGVLPDPMLTECFNLMPVENGLIAHDTLLPIGIPAIGFEYLGIYDQNHVMWFWSPWYDGGLEIWNRVPTHEYYKITNATPDVTPWWWPVEDELGTIWYLYPNVITGQPILSATQPVNGESTLELGFTIRSVFFEDWTYKVNSLVYSWYSEVVRPTE